MGLLPDHDSRQSSCRPLGALPGIVLFQSALRIFGDADVIGAIGALHNVAVVHADHLAPLDKLGTPNPLDLVEAAGVEPASEDAAGGETTYLVAFPRPCRHFRRPRSECDKKRGPLVRWSRSPDSDRARVASLLVDALPQPADKIGEDGYLTN